MGKTQKNKSNKLTNHFRLGYQIALSNVLKMVQKSRQAGQPPPPLSVPREKKEKQRKNPAKILKDVSNRLQKYCKCVFVLSFCTVIAAEILCVCVCVSKSAT
jgi:hypothetical protein